MRDPLLAPLAAIATGILVSRWAPLETRELLGSIAALLLLGIVCLARQARALAGACCLLGLVFAGALADVAHRPPHPPRLDAEGPVILTGCVVEPPVISGDRERFVLELEPGARVQVSLYLRDGQPPPRIDYGQRVEFDARVRSPHNFGNPGAFDYVRYLARRDIYWTAATRSDAPFTVLGTCGSRLRAAVMRIRAAALERIARLYDNRPYETGMMQAILVGESFQLEKLWTEQFRSTGTFHAIVISGTHVAVLAAFFLLLLRICFVPRGTAWLLTVAASWMYALVTGWQAPCVRSAAGLTLFLIGRYLFRERRLLNLVAAVAIGFLLLDPEQMFEPSFQLSFLAVGFIAAFGLPLLERTTAPLARALSDLQDTSRDLHMIPRAAQFRVEMRLLAEVVSFATRLPERLAALLVTVPGRALFYVFEIVLISAVVQVGLALPMVVYFHRVGFSGLSANAVIVPLFGLLVPIGFLAVATGWLWLAKIAGWLLAASQAVVAFHARWEPNWRIPDPPVWLGIALAAAFVAMAVLPRLRIPASLLTAALLALLIWHPFPPLLAKKELEFTAIDVGQGDSLLVAFPDGKLMVVDGGGIPAFGRRSPPRIDIGEEVVSPYLWSRSIRSLDVLALSHAHEDHINGLAALLENFHVKELWTGLTPESAAWHSLRATALKNGTRIVPLRRGRRLAYGGADLQVLSPGEDATPTPSAHNNDSLVLRLEFGHHAFLLTGDIERKVEMELAAGGWLNPSDVLKTPHHGSRTSSTSAFLDAARPAFAIISAGLDNLYGNPHPDVLKRLEQRRVFVLRTDRDGLISLRSDGYRLRVDTTRWSGRKQGLYRVF